jgi:hypothetical protein
MKTDDPDVELLKSVAVQLMRSGAVTLVGQKVRVGKTSRQRLRTARFLMKGREYEAIEQNAEKPSRWGNAGGLRSPGSAVPRHDD